MNLVPYTLTVLSRQDIPDTPTDRNIVIGAVVTCTNAQGATVTMFDDAAGSNGSTAKQTGVNGQVTVYVPAGEYTFSVNGREQKVVIADGGLRGALAATDSDVPVAGQQAKKYFATFDTVAEMQTAITSEYVGRKVQWLGYYELSDGGSGWGTVKSGPYTADGGKIISVGTNLYIEQNIKGYTLNARKYGVRGDASTNDTLQMQRCLDSGHKNIVVPRGVFLLDSLTLPDYITVTGTGYQAGVAGGDRITEFRFSITNSSNAITCGQEPVIKNIIFINVGGTYSEETKTLSGTTAGCIKLSANAVIEECSFYLWHQCIRTGPSTFYLTTDKVEFNRCTSGYVAEDTSPYNMNIRAPKSSLTEFFIVGIGDDTPRNIKVMGGAIEGYTAVAVRFIDIAFFGTYFESEPERTVFNAIEPQVNGSNVSLFGCTIFMNRTARFVNMSGLNNVGLTGSGNTFTGAMSSAGIAYFLPSSGSVSLAGDSIDSNIASNLSYVDSIAQAQLIGGIKMPQLQASSPQFLYSDIMFTGQRGFAAFPLSVEPANRISGQMVLADGASWDPLALSSGRPYYVIWQGDRWRAVSG